MTTLLSKYKDALEPLRLEAIQVIENYVPKGSSVQLSTGSPESLNCTDINSDPEFTHEDFMDELSYSLPSVIYDGDSYGLWRVRHEEEGIRVDGILVDNSEYTQIFDFIHFTAYDLCELADFIAKNSPEVITLLPQEKV